MTRIGFISEFLAGGLSFSGGTALKCPRGYRPVWQIAAWWFRHLEARHGWLGVGSLPLCRIPLRWFPFRRILLCRFPLCRIPLCQISWWVAPPDCSASKLWQFYFAHTYNCYHQPVLMARVLMADQDNSNDDAVVSTSNWRSGSLKFKSHPCIILTLAVESAE